MTASATPPLVPEHQQVPQDWPRLARHLAAHGMNLDSAVPPVQFAGGYGNLNYRLVVDGRPVVLRRPPPGPAPAGAHDMIREGRILTGLAPLLELVPRCLHSCESQDVLGAPFIMMEYRAGVVIRDRLPAAHAALADVGARLTDTLVSVLARLHRIEPEQAGLATLGRPENFLERTARGWARRAEQAWDGSPPPLAHDLPARIERHRPGPYTAVLLHNDYKLDNLILDPDTLAPRALIDWDLGTRGSALWDLAVLLSYWSQPDDPAALRTLGQMPTASGGFPSRTEVAALYAEETGRDLSELHLWRAVAQFRLAVVFRQIYRRYRESGTGDPAAARFDDLADGLMDVAGMVMDREIA